MAKYDFESVIKSEIMDIRQLQDIIKTILRILILLLKVFMI
jgi:hypothetical protein